MRANFWKSICAMVLVGVLACTARAQSPLTTIYTSNNGFTGQVTVYFDITLASPVLITRYDVNSSLAAGGAVTMEVYITAAGGTYAGNEVNPSAWTLQSSGSGTAAGQDQPTVLNCNTPFTMTPGTYGMAIIYTNPRYTDGTGANQNYATGDLVMSIACGAARNTTAPFTGGTAFSPRVFNGAIHFIPGDLSAVGACCLTNGTCTSVTGNDCLAAMGAPRGGGTTCPPTPACPQPGACCDTALNCTFVLQSACTGGSLWLAGTCTPTNPCSTPPANDTCAGATILGTGPTAFPYTTTAANFSAGEDALNVSCNTGNTAGIKFSIWYTYSPTANGALTFTETGTQDVVWAVWTGASCPDSSTAPQALCSLTDTAQGVSVTAGTPVYICVGRQGSTTTLPTANLSLSFDFIPAPANDACATATILGTGPTAFPYTATLNNRGAGADAANVSCNTGSLSSVLFGVWYTYTASGPGVLTFTETGTQDVVWAAYTGASCPDGSTAPAQCQITDTAQSIALTAGQTVYFLLGKQGSATALPTADLAVSFSFAPAPANDLCGGAIALALKTPVTGSLAAASNDYQITAANPPYAGVVQTTSNLPGRDVVYTFTPAATGGYNFRLQTNGANFGLFIMDTCPTGTSPISVGNAPGGVILAANRPTGTTALAEELVNVALTSGTQYWIVVDQAATLAAGTFALEVHAASLETEPNGTPATANTYSFGDSGMVGSINPVAEADFYSLGSPAVGSRIFALADSLASASNDTDMRITTDTATLEYDDAGADTPFGSLAPICVGTVAPGGPLYIRMSGFSSTTLYEPYHLLAVVQPPSSLAAPETEPNDTSATASSNALNYFAGAMASTTDADFYSFTATAGELIFIGLDQNPNRNVTTTQNLLLDLRSADGTTVLVAVNDLGTTASNTAGTTLTSTTPTSTGEALWWRAQYTGTYYARVTASTVVAPGSYLLSITKHPVVDPGACCTGTTCTFVAQSSCAGNFLGVGTTCSGTPCTPGACCLQAGGCSVVIPSQCVAPNIFRGDAACPPSVACPAIGACCNGTACSITFSANCSFTWTASAACVPNSCLPSDVCAGAEALSIGSIYTPAAPNATDDGIDPACSGTTTRFGVWFTYTNTGADGGLLNVSESSANDVIMQAFTGPCNALVQAGCFATDTNQNIPVGAGQTVTILLAMESATTVPTVAYTLTANSFTPTTGACCNGTSCTVVTQSSCTGLWLGVNSSCAGGPQASESPAAGIPDMVGGVPGVLTRTLPVAGSGTVSDLSLNVDITHAWGGDLRMTLTAPDSTTVEILARTSTAGVCIALDAIGPGSDFAGLYTFSDTGAVGINTQLIVNAAVLAPGVYRAQRCNGGIGGTLELVTLNTAFAGVPVAGNWTLTIYDDDAAIVGTLNSWSLTLNGGTAPPCTIAGACCNGASCSLVTDAAACPGAPSNYQGGGSTCSPTNPCSAPTTDNCCRGTTCNPVTAGTCTGIVAGSNSLVRPSCGAGGLAFASCCYADFNHDGSQSIDDLFLYFNAYFTSSPWAKFGGNGVAQPAIDDLFLYINAYFGTCS